MEIDSLSVSLQSIWNSSELQGICDRWGKKTWRKEIELRERKSTNVSLMNEQLGRIGKIPLKIIFLIVILYFIAPSFRLSYTVSQCLTRIAGKRGDGKGNKIEISQFSISSNQIMAIKQTYPNFCVNQMAWKSIWSIDVVNSNWVTYSFSLSFSLSPSRSLPLSSLQSIWNSIELQGIFDR